MLTFSPRLSDGSEYVWCGDCMRVRHEPTPLRDLTWQDLQPIVVAEGSAADATVPRHIVSPCSAPHTCAGSDYGDGPCSL